MRSSEPLAEKGFEPTRQFPRLTPSKSLTMVPRLCAEGRFPGTRRGMTRRYGLLFLGVGLCSGVISACTHTNAGVAVRGAGGDERQALSDAIQRAPASTILVAHATDEGKDRADEKVEP